MIRAIGTVKDKWRGTLIHPLKYLVFSDDIKKKHYYVRIVHERLAPRR